MSILLVYHNFATIMYGRARSRVCEGKIEASMLANMFIMLRARSFVRNTWPYNGIMPGLARELGLENSPMPE
jgi:hypothetical protein